MMFMYKPCSAMLDFCSPHGKKVIYLDFSGQGKVWRSSFLLQTPFSTLFFNNKYYKYKIVLKQYTKPRKLIIFTDRESRFNG